MRMLFEIDKKNYEKGGKTARRPSVRGIMIKDGKVAMMHSVRYDYYKLPGGGIEDEESLEDTLVREVREESGLIVDKDTIKELEEKITKLVYTTKETFKAEMFERSSIGTISEIYDSTEPYEERGAFAQAWSVAEIFRIVLNKR